MGGNTGGDGRVGGIDGERVGSAVGIGVLGNHLGEGEEGGKGGWKRSAYQTTRFRGKIRRAKTGCRSGDTLSVVS